MTSPLTGALKLFDGVEYALVTKEQAKNEVKCSDSSEEPKALSYPNTYMLSPNKLSVLTRGDSAPVSSALPVEEKVRRALSVAEECIQPEELETLFKSKPNPVCYDGFEPSGRMHVAQGLLKAINVNKLTSSGCVFVFWVADYFAMLNNKLGGDLRKIQRVGHYFIEVWKAVGMNLENVRFLWASEEIGRAPAGYWGRVMDIARKNSISRVKRCSQIMGRAEGDDQPCANVLYPCMQCADVFYIGADLCQLGMDQRKVNMLAREYVDLHNAEVAAQSESSKKKSKDQQSENSDLEAVQDSQPLAKPVILSHGMLPGLLEGQEKMSKSDPDSAIFMEDSVQDVNRKIKKAFCPPGVIEANPIMAYLERIIFGFRDSFQVKRAEKNGGDVVYNSYDEVKEAYVAGDLHPADLKSAVASVLNELIEPVREHFAVSEFSILLTHFFRMTPLPKL
eukprot:Protomagalhaensia_wolfi_Nauph_80__971@NODE_1561_length_1468_cov_688_082575_g69_i2_p1_GENE_NODE_1561_length_1468_cov_688_082575_g69_i2NODE_1561_length_1468_cov_688_082575_g69_i2_p1_ORF_typecomplete_len484_score111_85tRNAsynt_1b/PF00579_25/3_3e67_NODE_1561_length_1468_cov_688_082575_g69_i21051454